MTNLPEVAHDTVVINGPDAKYAWGAIALQAPNLLPSPELPVEGHVELIGGEEKVLQMVKPGDGVEWRGGFEYVNGPHHMHEHPDQRQSVVVQPKALPHLVAGLKKFQEQGPSKADFTHLRVREIVSTVRKRRAANRMLSQIVR